MSEADVPLHELTAIAIALGWLALAALTGLVVHRIVFALLTRWAQQGGNGLARAIVRRTERPAAFIAPLVGILIVLPSVVLPPRFAVVAEHAAEVLTIASLAWTVVAMIRLWTDLAVGHRNATDAGSIAARQFGTRVEILSRTAIILVAVVAFGSMLMTFPPIRAFGTSLLASAGVAGLVVGLAARPLFENLVAGVQLALTQPIRLNDAVVIEKQFGRIEEIHATFVIVRLPDLRRMIVPLTYFINIPFENWTHSTGGLIGEVLVFTDYTHDIAALRGALPKILAGTPLWDGEVAKVEVNATTDRAIQLRVQVSARTAEDLMDLRSYALEMILTYLREQQPDAYPRSRNETHGAPARP